MCQPEASVETWTGVLSGFCLFWVSRLFFQQKKELAAFTTLRIRPGYLCFFSLVPSVAESAGQTLSSQHNSAQHLLPVVRNCLLTC